MVLLSSFEYILKCPPYNNTIKERHIIRTWKKSIAKKDWTQTKLQMRHTWSDRYSKRCTGQLERDRHKKIKRQTEKKYHTEPVAKTE